jgi:hypothetical protein
MTLLIHAQEAAHHLEQALAHLETLQTQPQSQEQVQEWLSTLTDGLRALRDLQSFSEESLREQLSNLAGQLRRYDLQQELGGFPDV